MTDLMVQCDFNVSFRPNDLEDDESGFLVAVHGRAWIENSAGDQLQEIAHLQGYIVRLSYGDGADMDAETADLGAIAGQVLTGEDWSAQVYRLFPTNNCEPNLLVVDRVSTRDAFKGYGAGLALIRRFTQVFGDSCAFCALIAQPLQHTGSDRTTASKSAQTSAKKKLRAHYEKLGFLQLNKNTDVMAVDLGQELPSHKAAKIDLQGLLEVFEKSADQEKGSLLLEFNQGPIG
jgi:predicted GNAT family N-acyltransferase